MVYSEEEKESVFEDILEEIIDGRGIRSILQDRGMPRALSFYKWLKDRPEWQERYAYACELRQEFLFEKMMEIANTPEEGVEVTYDHNGIKEVHKDMIQHRNLKVNTLKWQLAKLNPKKYGEKVDLTTDGDKIQNPNVTWNFIDAKKPKE
jgi:hypothetical protein